MLIQTSGFYVVVLAGVCAGAEEITVACCVSAVRLAVNVLPYHIPVFAVLYLDVSETGHT